MVSTKCPAIYKNVGLETFGNKKKVTEELLKQFCKNDEYLYQQVRKLLDLTDPESRKRFHPPTFEDETKSFGYVASEKGNLPCYKFDDGGEYVFSLNFNTKDDKVNVISGITYYDDESIIDFDKTDSTVNINVVSSDENGYVCAVEGPDEEITHEEAVYKDVPKSTTKQVTKKVGNPVKDSWCYGPYGSMKPNGWWYVGFNINKNYNIKPAWKKKPYTEGIPTICRAQTFTARHTGYVTKVNVNVISESNKKSASPFCCEIWNTKKGVPDGGAVARDTKSFKDSNAYSGAHIKSFNFKKKANVVKGHKYAVVFRSPLSYRDSCYRIAGWPRTCYTDYMKGAYYYGAAYVSSDNGKSWIKYDKNAYGKLNTSKGTMPVAFGFEVYVQPTKTTKVKSKKQTTKKKIGTKTVVDEVLDTYDVGDHYIYFNLPVTNPIYELTIDEGETENLCEEGNEILWDISYNGEEFNNNFLIEDMGRGAGVYNLETVKPTFITIRANLKNTSKYTTPILRSCRFSVHTDPAKKAYVRGLPYCPESETMLPACIWSEVHAKYEQETNSSVKIDIVREVEAQKTIRIRKDTLDDLWDYYHEYYPTKVRSDYTDATFRTAIQKDSEFIEHLKKLEVPVYVISVYSLNDPNYFQYFTSIDLPHYPAYPMVSCHKLLGEKVISVEDFIEPNYNVSNTQYTLNMGRALTNDLVNIVFHHPIQSNIPVQGEEEEGEEDIQEGVVENILVYDENYTSTDGFSSNEYDYALTSDNKGIIFNLSGENFLKNVVLDGIGQVKCYKLTDGSIEVESEEELYDVAEDETYDSTLNENQIGLVTGDIVELVVNLRDKAYTENINYVVDYNNKTLTPRPSMLSDLSSCELLFTYNPLWVRDLTSDNLPLKMDLWTETFMSDDYFNSDGKVEFITRVSPRDNLREVVLWDEEDTLTRIELEEDVDFVVDYQTNKITFEYPVEEETPITIRYTPNLTDTSLSIAYRMDRSNVNNQAYIYGNYFTTRT